MKRNEVVKSKILFNEILKKGRKVSNSYYSIFCIDAENKLPLYGISAPKKLGNAVVRNKLKRQMRHILDNSKYLFKNNRNYIIIMRERCLFDSFDKRMNAFKHLIGEINEK